MNPLTLTLQDAKQLIASAQNPLYPSNKLFIDGDHWQAGAGWIGPMPKTTDDGYEVAFDTIASGFTSRNVMKEVVDRHVGAVLGREPSFNFTPRRPSKKKADGSLELSDTEQRLIDEASALVTDWWYSRNIQNALALAVGYLLWAERGIVRLYVPRGLLQRRTRSDGAVERILRSTNGDFATAFQYVWLDTPLPENATVYTDPDTKANTGLFYYTYASTAPGEPNTDYGELSYALGPTVTQLAILTNSTDKVTANLNLGGRITMYQMTRPLLITQQVQQCQKAFNLAISVLPRNIVSAGFLERAVLNAQLPGTWEHDENGVPTVFTPAPYRVGAGTTNWLEGVKYHDAEGNEKLADPQILWRDPTPVDPTIKAKGSHYQDLLEEVMQSHILLQDEALASGKSREQARADFIASIQLTQRTVEDMGRWMCETALAMAEHFAGKPGYYTTQLRVEFNTRPDYGPLNAEERRQAQEAVTANLLSEEEAMVRMGVDDIDAEKARIAAQTSSKLTISEKQASVFAAWINAGMDVEFAAEKAGLTPEELSQVKAARQKALDEQRKLQDEEAARAVDVRSAGARPE